MYIEVTKEEEKVFEGLADDFLEMFNYDSELEEILSQIDNQKIGYDKVYDCYSIEKIFNENIY